MHTRKFGSDEVRVACRKIWLQMYDAVILFYVWILIVSYFKTDGVTKASILQELAETACQYMKHQ